MDALVADTGVGWLAALLEGSVGCTLDSGIFDLWGESSVPLLAVGGTLSTGGRPLVAGVARDTHDCGS